MQPLDIKAQPNQYDDHFLDVIGNDFKFDHAKGLAEWLKNSADAYQTTAKVKDLEQFIVLRFKQGQPKKNSVFECIDFVGMTSKDIDKALKIWGNPKAAKKGTNIATFGGHGNGGKFYMRQMFRTSRYVTFRGGLLNVFGFNEKKKYGYAKSLQDKTVTLQQALQFAGIDDLDIPDIVLKRWKAKSKDAGFTVVVGEHPERFSGRSTMQSILENLRVHPQARRLLNHKQIIYMRHGDEWGKRLELPQIEPRVGREKALSINLPKKFEHAGETHEFKSGTSSGGRLFLRTSQQPLGRSRELAAMNVIDILGEVGCIGSYRMNELGFLRFAPEAEFIYGECEAAFLEDPELDCVRNDREKLVENELTRALLEWIRQQVDTLAEKMAEERKKDEKSRDLRQSSLFNQILDRWKNRFMVKLQSDLFGGSGIGATFGGSGGGGGANAGTGSGSGGAGDGGGGTGDGENGGGDGTEPRKGPNYPRVLLSGHDVDPLDDLANAPFFCDPRQPPVYQRYEDTVHNIYWINTSRALAQKIMDRYGSDSPRWREYLFQRHIEIMTKQSIHQLGKNEPTLTADKVDQLIDDLTMRVHDAAADDLEQFLFEENMTGSAAIVELDADAPGPKPTITKPTKKGRGN
jgi:hypothetical protein